MQLNIMEKSTQQKTALAAQVMQMDIRCILPNEGQIAGVPVNPRTISEAQFKRLCKSLEETPEMLSHRQLIVYPIEEGKYVTIGGNQRLRALQALGYTSVPVSILPVTTSAEELRAIIIKDNASFGDWDVDLLANEWDSDPLIEWGIEDALPSFGEEEEGHIDPDAEESDEEEESQEDITAEPMEEDDFNEEDRKKVEERVSYGDVWQLGDHRLLCGDSTKAEDVARVMFGEKANLVFTDPPYGMKKEKEGVVNDNLNYDDLLEFNKKWVPLSFEALAENGSWYCWGIDEPLMDLYHEILKPMQRANKITFRNLLTWDKGDAGAGGVSFMGKDGLRSYPVSDEKCLFVMCGVQGFNNNADNYYEGFEPLRKYMEDEAKKVGLTPQKLKEITGVGMWSHWFSTSQYSFIPEHHYKKLQEYYQGQAFGEKYEAIREKYEAIREKYEAIREKWYETRSYFNNTHDKMKSVWEFGRTRGEERAECGDHATPKPLALCERGIKSSSREGERVLDLFGGSGSTLIACERLGRKCHMIEYTPHYCDVIIARWEKESGKKAVKLDNYLEPTQAVNF